MTFTRRGFILAMPVLGAACASADLAPLAQFRMGVMVRDSNDGAWRAPAPGSANVALALYPIAGDFFGRVTGPSAAISVMNPTGVLGLDLVRLRETTARAAAPVGNASVRSGQLVVVPAGIRMTRVATIAVDLTKKQGLGLTGLYGVADGIALILVYFSGPCSLRGLMSSQPDDVQLDLAIPAEGLHWLQFAALSPGRKRLSLLPGTPQAFVGITLADEAKPSGTRT